jgi:hypothetical protein
MRDERPINIETFLLQADDKLKEIGLEYPITSISHGFIDGALTYFPYGNAMLEKCGQSKVDISFLLIPCGGRKL